MLIYLLKASLVLAVFYVFYKLFLEKESFFVQNRIYLFGGLLLSFLLPFIALPLLFEKQGILSIALEKQATQMSALSNDAKIDGIYPMDQPIVAPASEINSPKLKNDIPTEVGLESPPARTDLSLTHNGLSLSHWLVLLYALGVAASSLYLFSQLLAILRGLWIAENVFKDGKYVIVNSSLIDAPCSFFNLIFINPANYDPPTYEQILAHEKTHTDKLHTIDLLLAELVIILLWFNPIAWLYRREIEKAVEYQTDEYLIKEGVVDRQDYQMNLLRVASRGKSVAILTHYNYSLIKQRILKMSAQKSNQSAFWKFAFVGPLMLATILVLNKPGHVVHQQQDKVFSTNCAALLAAIKKEDISSIKTVLELAGANCIYTNAGREELEVDGMEVFRTNPKSPLLAAARIGNTEIANILIKANADVDLQTHDNETPLMAAAQRGDLAMLELLVENGADINKSTKDHGTALTKAAQNGHLEAVSLLVRGGADIDHSSLNVSTPLVYAVRNGHLEVVKYLVGVGADIEKHSNILGTPLMCAIQYKQTDLIHYFLNNGADINKITKKRSFTPLYVAALYGHTELVKLLIDRGAEVNLAYAYPPIWAAAFSGHPETIDVLLANGADIDQEIFKLGTPLMMATRRGMLHAIELLIAKGASIDKESVYENTPLRIAYRQDTPGHVRPFVNTNSISNKPILYPGNALMAAVRENRYESAKTLLEAGADPNYQSKNQDTPIQIARSFKNKKMLKLLKKYH